MTPVDWIALAIMAGSTILGALRGLIREAISLAAWVAAFVAAQTLSPWVAVLMPGPGQEGLRQAAAIVLVFVAVLVLAHLLAAGFSRLARMAGLGGYDRLLGMAFGAGRACVALVLLTLVAGLTALPRSEAWRTSLVHERLESAAVRLIPWLPNDVAVLIRFK